MAVGIFCRVWNTNKVVSDVQMEVYGKTFLRRYEKLMQSKVRPAYQKYFSFLKNKPILIDASISTTHGAAVMFIPFETRKFRCRTVTTRIDREVFPDKDLNISKIEGDTNNATVLIYGGKPGPMFSISGNGEFRRFSVITNKGWFLDLLETGSLRTKEISVDDISYPNMIIIKGSNRRSTWCRKAAKEDALDQFYSDFCLAYFDSEEFREFVATPELTHIAKEIDAKQKAGDYGGEYGYLALQEDIAKLKAAADAHGIKHEFTENILAFSKEQPGWRERRPIMFNVMCGVVGGILLIFLIWFAKWGWKWIWVKLGR